MGKEMVFLLVIDYFNGWDSIVYVIFNCVVFNVELYLVWFGKEDIN